MNVSKTVLLVEDDKDDQAFFIEALGEIKNAILYGLANNGKEALDKLENALIPPDLIFMDINMPVMNGIECLSEIFKKPHTLNIPVVILSSDKWQMELVRNLGAKAFITKPSDSKTLRMQLEQIISPDFPGNA